MAGNTDTSDALIRKERPEKMKPPKPKFSNPSTLVTFLVGPEDNVVKFVVHKEFACYHSSVLNAAFNGDFVEGQTQTYRIEDTSPGAFTLFVQWLYTQKLDLYQLMTEHEREMAYGPTNRHDHAKRTETEDVNLAELWILADKLIVPKLQNLAIEGMVKIAHKYSVAFALFNYIYENTASGSPLRSFVIEQCSLEVDTSNFIVRPECFPHQLLLDVAIYSGNHLRSDGEPEYEPSEFFVPED